MLDKVHESLAALSEAVQPLLGDSPPSMTAVQVKTALEMQTIVRHWMRIFPDPVAEAEAEAERRKALIDKEENLRAQLAEIEQAKADDAANAADA